jgi:iduronate 2-sulfatase
MSKHIERRRFLANLGVATLSLTFASRLAAKKNAHRPNILFIAVDDLRPQLGCYGRKEMITPNIDALAASGTLFERAYCQVAVCGASRASLLSGLRPNANRFKTHKDRVSVQAPEATTLPAYLKQNGFVTISNGKIYHHWDDDIDAWSKKPFRARGEHQYFRPENIALHKNNQTLDRKRNTRGPSYESADAPIEQYPDHIMTDKSIRDLKQLAGGDKPFFLAAGFARPHLPFNAPKEFWDMYDEKEINLADNPFRPKGCPDVALHQYGELRHYDGVPPKGPIADELAKKLIHGYYACTSFVDYEVGRLLKALDDLNLRKNTIVILWGDHGWQLGEHALWCKHSNFETSTHVPMLISAPGFPNNRTRALVEFVDIYPTLCELSSLPLPEHLEGSSYVPLMRDPGQPWKQAAFSRWGRGWSVRTDRYRYTEWRDKNGDMSDRMLYDHENDPNENVNSAEQPENGAIVGELSGMLGKGWRAFRKQR